MKFIKITQKIFVLLIALYQSLRLANASNKKRKTRRLKKENCSAGFGYAGKCLSKLEELTKLQTGPELIKGLWTENVTPLIKKLTDGTSACVGDYQTSSSDLSQFNCGVIPWQSGTMGYFGLNTTKLKCFNGQVTFCVTFDQCGSFGIVANKGALQCLATATGIGGMLTNTIENINNAQFAFSVNKKLAMSYNIATFTPTGFAIKTLDVTGHFYVGVNMKIPSSWLQKIKIGKLTGDKVITLAMNVEGLLDLGKSSVQNTINSLSKAGSNSKNILNEIMNLNAELSIIANGKLTLSLNQLTNGFLPNLSFDIKNCNLLLTPGGGSSGMEVGLYAQINLNQMGNFSEDFQSNLNAILGQYKDMLKGFSLPKIQPDLNLSISVGISPTQIGFSFNSKVITITCMFNVSDSSCSCGFGSKFFTALLKDGNYAIQQAGKLFDKGGKEIGKMVAGAENFLKKVGSFVLG